jgi:uncharacterized membrane-anchored protein
MHARLQLPADHPLRAYVNNEMHARPADELDAPLLVSYIALFSAPDSRDLEWQQLCELVQRFQRQPPALPVNHFSADLGPFRMRWERHTEFVRYTFIVAGGDVLPQHFSALSALPPDWLASLSGSIIAASHAALLVGDEDSLDIDALAATHFAGQAPAGASIAGGAALALTDFRVQADGFSRILLFDQGLTPRLAGRLMQSLLELETYRLLALLALPVARELAPALGRFETELSAVTTALAQPGATDESALLDRLTRLQAQIEALESNSLYRFDAAAAYYELVQRRIDDLRETRLPGMPTFREFVERRLAPAMHTCRAVAARLDSLSQRVARANQLLATRVDITRERQNQSLLESMNSRARQQLRLQQTVEGLSVAAVTYYVVGLVGYAAKGAKAAGYGLDADITMAAGIPVVALLVAFAVHKARKVIHQAGKESS